MVVLESSFTGLFRTLLLIIGALVALRFIGRLMIAKRNLEEERELLRREKAFQQERNDKLKNFGKTSVVGQKPDQNGNKAEDVDFEEVKP
jgi:hypothetical protein